MCGQSLFGSCAPQSKTGPSLFQYEFYPKYENEPQNAVHITRIVLTAGPERDKHRPYEIAFTKCKTKMNEEDEAKKRRRPILLAQP